MVLIILFNDSLAGSFTKGTIAIGVRIMALDLTISMVKPSAWLLIATNDKARC
jgi:hypothetical protein